MVEEKIGMKEIGLTFSQVPSFKTMSSQGMGLVVVPMNNLISSEWTWLSLVRMKVVVFIFLLRTEQMKDFSGTDFFE